MKVLKVVSPVLKIALERVGKPEIINLPDVLRPGGMGAVVTCNHIGWADSLWLTYAVHPRQLRHMSKRELFDQPITKWVLGQIGSIPINRADPLPSSIKVAVDILNNNEVILIFPTGTRNEVNMAFKRGAATIALHARVPLVPAFYQGPKQMETAHLLNRPRVGVTFGAPIPTTNLAIGKQTIMALTKQLQVATDELRSIAGFELSAAV
jgi:1-acyl-sn-glycerol-3-phosphate acyltransferase